MGRIAGYRQFCGAKIKKEGHHLHDDMQETDNLLNYLEFDATVVFKQTLRVSNLPFTLMLLLNLVKGPKLMFVFNRLYVRKSQFESDLLEYIKKQPVARSRDEAQILQEDNQRVIEDVLWKAAAIARENGRRQITYGSLFLSLLEVEPLFKKMLDPMEINP